jgi:hypothetical protein
MVSFSIFSECSIPEMILRCSFKSLLPKQCSLLREKVFPEDTLPDSPDLGPSMTHRGRSRSLSRQPSRELSIPPLALSREPSLPRMRDPAPPPVPLPGRERSRSRSVSVTQDDGRSRSKPRKDLNMQTAHVVNFRRTLSKPSGKLDMKNGKDGS